MFYKYQYFAIYTAAWAPLISLLKHKTFRYECPTQILFSFWSGSPTMFQTGIPEGLRPSHTPSDLLQGSFFRAPSRAPFARRLHKCSKSRACSCRPTARRGASTAARAARATTTAARSACASALHAPPTTRARRRRSSPRRRQRADSTSRTWTSTRLAVSSVRIRTGQAGHLSSSIWLSRWKLSRTQSGVAPTDSRGGGGHAWKLASRERRVSLRHRLMKRRQRNEGDGTVAMVTTKMLHALHLVRLVCWPFRARTEAPLRTTRGSCEVEAFLSINVL